MCNEFCPPVKIVRPRQCKENKEKVLDLTWNLNPGDATNSHRSGDHILCLRHHYLLPYRITHPNRPMSVASEHIQYPLPYPCMRCSAISIVWFLASGIKPSNRLSEQCYGLTKIARPSNVRRSIRVPFPFRDSLRHRSRFCVNQFRGTASQGQPDCWLVQYYGQSRIAPDYER